jgi:hypothetical protein
MAERKDGKELYLYLKAKTPYDPNVYLEVNVKSKTFKVTEKGREECILEYCKITGKFDEEKFQIVNSIFATPVKFSDVEEWEHDKKQPDKKIDLYLKKAMVLYVDIKIELEDL